MLATIRNQLIVALAKVISKTSFAKKVPVCTMMRLTNKRDPIIPFYR